MLMPSFVFGQMMFFTQVPAGSSYSTEYQAVLDEISTQGWTEPSEAQKLDGDSLCICLVANSIWDELDWLMIARNVADKDQALGIDWKNPSSPAFATTEPGGSIAWTTSTGFRKNSSAIYINMGWAPNDGINYTQNNASIGFWGDNFVSASQTSGAYMFGSRLSSTNYVTWGSAHKGGAIKSFRYAGNSGAITVAANTYSGENMAYVFRQNSSTHNHGLDGTTFHSASETSQFLLTYDLFLFGINNTGTYQSEALLNSEIHAAWAGSGDIDFSDLHTCLDNFFN